MNYHKEILAKSGVNGSICLYQHLKSVADMAVIIGRERGLDEQIAYEGGALHDIGKASHIFQERLIEDPIKNEIKVFRHEIASLFFISLLPESHRNAVIEMIVAHHKSVYNDISNLGFLDLDDLCPNSFQIHSNGFNEWSINALHILEALGIQTHRISIEEAKTNYNYALEYCNNLKSGCSQWRGLLMASDHRVSATEGKTEVPLDKMFIKPDLNFYERQNELYPLSLVPIDETKKHTMVTAPTGAGKTDFLMRCCKGRVFYILPFQASINAMYDRFKNDLKDTNAQIYLQHASSALKTKGKALEETIMQRYIGASIKVMTPHQIASIVFGIKGYESVVLDLKECDVILDEIHTYSDTIQAIVLRIIEVLVSLNCRIHIGTATMPTELYNQILELLGGSSNVYEVRLNNEVLETFNRHQVYKLKDNGKMFDVIDDSVKSNKKILIVCNQVERAQKIYDTISCEYQSIDKMLIHSRYKRKDRTLLEDTLREEFNTMDNKPCIVVSTQVVEVSLDISFDVMVTECAPIDALIQRFGRINRKRNKNTIGHYKPVYVIEPPHSEKDCLPYSKETLEETFHVLPDNGEVMKENEIQSMIDRVYSNVEIEGIEASGVIFFNGEFQKKLLCHNAKSCLADALSINSTVCITESDKNAYLEGDSLIRTELEIPVSYNKKYHNLEQLKKGTCPFVIPNKAYDKEKGLLKNLI